MVAVSACTTKNYSREPVAVYLFRKSVNLSFILEFKSGVIKEVSSAKMPHSFAAVEVLMKHTFFSFSAFLNVLMGSQRFSTFFLELLME